VNSCTCICTCTCTCSGWRRRWHFISAFFGLFDFVFVAFINIHAIFVFLLAFGFSCAQFSVVSGPGCQTNAEIYRAERARETCKLSRCKLERNSVPVPFTTVSSCFSLCDLSFPIKPRCQRKCGDVVCTEARSQCCSLCGSEMCHSADMMCPIAMCADFCGGKCGANERCCLGCPDNTGADTYSCAGVCPAIKCAQPRLCPDGSTPVNCFADPCSTQRCPGDPYAICTSNYCGGCNAVWTTRDGKPANCGSSSI